MSNKANLVVYKASAGSGKTFNLVLEYVSLLIKDTKSYGNILAVTFTNKATAEMKLRILKELYGIKIGENTGFFEALCKKYPEFSPKVIQEKASEALGNIIHDYSNFNIQTIDSFLQKVMRNLAKELGIGSNYNLIINDSDIIKETIDRVISSTDKDKALYDWYMGMIDVRVEEGKRINVEKELIEFSKNLDKEVFKHFESEIKSLDKEVLAEFKKMGNNFTKEVNGKLRDYEEKFSKMISDNGFRVEDFAYADVGVAGAFLKVSTEESFLTKKRVIDASEDANKWFSKSNSTESNLLFAETTLMPFLNEVIKYYSEISTMKRTWQAVLPFIDNIGLLKNIANHRDDILKEENKFLLSNTSKLLSDIIRLDNNSDISFIYEKIGSRIKYIMIDEFQDTSLLNWKTISPLVLESLDNNQRNVIVGDVKQSIYRWRNGDWRILNDIDKGVTSSGTIHNPRIPIIETLKTNYRTDKKVVEFNNSLFTQGLEDCCDNIGFDKDRIDQIKRVFSDVEQHTKPNATESGSVRVQILTGKKGSFQEKVLEKVKEEIDYYKNQGYSNKDIAILFRKNDQVSLVADFLSKQGCDVVSDMAFGYKYSKSVKLIIDALKYINNKDNTVSLFNLKRYVSNNEETPLGSSEALRVPQKLDWIERKAIIRKPLFDLIVHIIKQLKLDEDYKELSFITFFLDQVQEYTKNNSSNLSKFLVYWEEELQVKKININDDFDGIRLISIHKAKGLEFPVVILPFANWSFSSDDEVWLKENKLDPRIPTLLANNNNLKFSLYHEEYLDERLQQFVDNLNLLYVALTRPKHSLSIIGQLSRTKNGIEIKEIDNISKFLYSALGKQSKLVEEIAPDGEIQFNYFYGIMENKPKEKDDDLSYNTKPNIFEIKPDSIPIESSFLDSKIKYSQTKQAKEFVAALKYDEKEESSPRQKGIILHNLLSKINTNSDIEKTIETSVQKGEITHDQKDFYKTIIQEMLNTSKASEWFSSDYKILNEVDIVLKDEGQIITKRPDRLMITKDNEIILVDYKFAQTKKNIKQYSSQIKTYEQLIKQIGFNKIQSYLWFVNFDKEFTSEILEVV